jgi:hypothetical protein
VHAGKQRQMRASARLLWHAFVPPRQRGKAALATASAQTATGQCAQHTIIPMTQAPSRRMWSCHARTHERNSPAPKCTCASVQGRAPHTLSHPRRCNTPHSSTHTCARTVFGQADEAQVCPSTTSQSCSDPNHIMHVYTQLVYTQMQQNCSTACCRAVAQVACARDASMQQTDRALDKPPAQRAPPLQAVKRARPGARIAR